MSREDPSSPPIPQHDGDTKPGNDAAPNHKDDGRRTPTPVPTTPPTNRSNRPSRACTIRAVARIQAAQQQQQQAAIQRKQKPKREEQQRGDEEKEQCSGGSSKTVTPLVETPSEPAQLPRWNLQSMWELASILNFLHVFRQLLNVQVEFSAEEFETALIAPNDTLGDIHMPLLKAIPPITRMALTQDTWITVLCRKLRGWWHWMGNFLLLLHMARRYSELH